MTEMQSYIILKMLVIAIEEKLMSGSQNDLFDLTMQYGRYPFRAYFGPEELTKKQFEQFMATPLNITFRSIE